MTIEFTEYITVQEAAAIARVGERTIRHWIAKGLIPARKPSRRVLIPAGALKRFLEREPANV